jgi:hypothetical protein
VRDLVIHDDDLIAATHGRSFWILDDISPLREISDAKESKTNLFTPAHAIRTVSDGFLGTPLPVDEPQAENPARGAYIDYFLSDGDAGPVKLEFLNAKGELVRRYSSNDKTEDPSTKMPIAPRWLHKAPTLSAEPGMHRFIWDLRYERSGDGSVDDDDDENANFPGPFVLPGAYKVRLVTSAGSFEKPLQVVLDPRSAATPAALAEQFAWAKRVFQEVVTARKLNADLTAAKTNLRPDQAARRADLTAFDKQLAPVLRDLTAALTAFESADRTPTSQAIALYQESSGKFRSLQQHWRQLQTE